MTKKARDAVRSQAGTTVEEVMKRALMLDSAPLVKFSIWLESLLRR